MKLLVVVLLFPLLFCAQDQQYFTLQLELDARNALFGGTVNEQGYDIVVKGGFSAQWFRVDGFFEVFEVLRYKSSGVNFYGILNHKRAFKQGLGFQISFIDKPKKLTPSMGLNGLLEYHFGPVFISASGETKMRTDWRITVYSGFVGVGYKI